MNVYVKGKAISLDPRNSIGSGGEAEVFDMDKNHVLKIYKRPNHPDFANESDEKRKYVANQLRELEKKLPLFPANTPDVVLRPLELVTDRSGKELLGYMMRRGKKDLLLQYGIPKWRTGNVSQNAMVEILKSLHRGVGSVHSANIVIGDFSDWNVFVDGSSVSFIDADSMQFGAFTCSSFSPMFVDPLLCDPAKQVPFLVKRFGNDSDWYAYAVLLMQTLLYVGPYGGTHFPKKKNQKQVNTINRPMQRLTVFDSEVIYPKAGVSFGMLPDDLLHELHAVFQRDKRGVFPESLLTNLRWSVCGWCGCEHARNVCPKCSKPHPSIVKVVETFRGSVVASSVFKTTGRIVSAVLRDRKLLVAQHVAGSYMSREGVVLLNQIYNPAIRVQFSEDKTYIADGTVAYVQDKRGQNTKIPIDNPNAIAASDAGAWWASAGQLRQAGPYGSSPFGSVLENMTSLWAGEKFGFGYWRGGSLQSVFLWSVPGGKLRVVEKMPRLTGNIVASNAIFSEKHCWFFITTKINGRAMNQCFAIDASGVCVATAETDSGDDTWLGNIFGGCGVGDCLLVPVDSGVCKVEIDGSAIRPVKTYPDTAPFVKAGDALLFSQEGLYVVSEREITLLRMQ